MKSCLKPVTWFLTLIVLFAQSGSPTYIAYAQETQAELEANIAQLEKLFNALEAAAKDIPRDTFDLEAALALTDLTPEGLLAWVRDNTYLVPYKGALRGAQGVLMDRVGNSLDRAMLLQGLMQLLGYDTQLARAQLSEAQAQDILAKTHPIPAEGALPQTADTDINSELQKYVSEFGLEQTQLTKALEQANQQRATLQAEMKTRVASQTDFLMNALGNPTGDMAAEKAKQVASLQDHWWVQYQEGGVWVDLDPTMPNATPNQKIVAAGETLVATKLEELPADLLHTLQIKVVLECALDSGLTETTLVESPVLIPANVLGQRIAVSHLPVNMPRDFDSSDSTAFRTLVLEQERWFPVLSIGTQQLFTSDYTGSCEIGTATPPSTGTAIGGALEDALDVLGSMDGTDATTTTGERITAQWIDYIIRVPGETEQVVRRQIFDVLGPSARASDTAFTSSEQQSLSWRLTLFGETEILPLFSRLSSDFVDNLAVERWLAQQQNISALLRDPKAATQQLSLVPSGLYSLALVRSQWNSNPEKTFLDQLNIISQHVQIKSNSQGEMLLLQGFDIVANAVAVAPATVDTFTTRLAQGILDTNAESLLGAIACQDATQNIICTDVRGTAETFAQSQQQGTNWLPIQSSVDIGSKTTAWSEDALTRVKQDISDGYAVIVPERPVQSGEVPIVAWWRVDLQTGEILGIGENGWGQAMAEYAIELGYIAFYVCILGAAAVTGNLTGVNGAKCVFAGLGVAALASGSLVAALLAAIAASSVAGV